MWKKSKTRSEVLPLKLTAFWLQAKQAENKWKKNSLKIFNITNGIILDYK